MSFSAQHQSSSSKSASTATPTWASQFQPTVGATTSTLNTAMTDPTAGLGAVKAGGIGEINQQYKSLPDQIQSATSARGMGRAGQTADLMAKAETGRAGAIGGYESQFAQLVSQRQMQAASLADQLLAIAKGLSTTGTQSGSGTSFGGGIAPLPG